uniref:Uncharacterized protein n=1 Tax=viral metagenome TaxID=1070528 RepID=A0A6M3L9L4_9ZZZZ
MQTLDLFTKPLTDKERLWEWLKTKEFVKTSEILFWGCNNYSNRADRNARLLAQEGKLERLSKDEKILRFGNIGEEVYKVILTNQG